MCEKKLYKDEHPPKLPKSRHIVVVRRIVHIVRRIKSDNSEDIHEYGQLKRVDAVEMEGFRYELH